MVNIASVENTEKREPGDLRNYREDEEHHLICKDCKFPILVWDGQGIPFCPNCEKDPKSDQDLVYIE